MGNKKFVDRKVRQHIAAPKKPRPKASKEKTKYRLGSSEMVSAPGTIAWAINGYHFPKDRKHLLNVIVKGWMIPPKAAHALLIGAVPHKIDGETVEFEV